MFTSITFQAIDDTQKKSFYVAQQILQRIENGDMKPNDKLPPERIIAEQMEVSRTIVREALTALQLAGIIQSRVGDGTYVRSSPLPGNFRSGFEHIVKRIDAGLDVMEAIEAREALDLTAVHLAIENARPRDIREIKGILDRMEECITKEDYAGYVRLGFDFHLAVARASGNRFVEHGVTYLTDMTRKNGWIIEENHTAETVLQSLEIHRSIFTSIEQKDLSLALDSVKRHTDRIRAAAS